MLINENNEILYAAFLDLNIYIGSSTVIKK